MLVVSVGLWDMLHVRDVQSYRAELERLDRAMQPRPATSRSKSSVWWVSAPSLQNGKLGPKKHPLMSDSLAAIYNAAAVA